jgi:hypothetical protein
MSKPWSEIFDRLSPERKRRVRQRIEELMEEQLRESVERFDGASRLSFWKCNYLSATGHCEYLPADTAHDHCIYCGQPEERK